MSFHAKAFFALMLQNIRMNVFAKNKDLDGTIKLYLENYLSCYTKNWYT